MVSRERINAALTEMSTRIPGTSKSSPEYEAWRDMKKRCYDPSNVMFARYGGRGISVCASWRDSFERFLADVGPRPEGKTLDRRDNDKNYEPENVRWATRAEQNRNRSNTRFVDFKGRKIPLKQAAEELGVPYDRLLKRIMAGWDDAHVLNVTKNTTGPRAPLMRKNLR